MQVFFLKQYNDDNRGFAMLFTVLITSIILSIGLGISNLAFKQTILSSLAKDSQMAFYQADAAAECGMYYDITVGLFPRGLTVAGAPSAIACGSRTLALESSLSATNYFVYKENAVSDGQPCLSIVFDKVTSGTQSLIQARGYNLCASTPRQVERALQVSY